MTKAQKAIVERLMGGGVLCAQDFSGGPSCPFWDGTREFPATGSVKALFRSGAVRWAGEPPQYPAFGRLVLKAAA